MQFGAHALVVYGIDCDEKANAMALGLNGFISLLLLLIVLLNSYNWKQKIPLFSKIFEKLEARPPIRIYCSTLALGDICYSISYLVLFFSIDIGFW